MVVVIAIILVDDLQLRLQLTSELAGEFGLRVVHETINIETNGIIVVVVIGGLLISAICQYRSIDLPVIRPPRITLDCC